MQNLMLLNFGIVSVLRAAGLTIKPEHDSRGTDSSGNASLIAN